MYENTANNGAEKNSRHTITLSFKGTPNNNNGIGATVRIYYDKGKQQLYEQHPCRGYMSTDDNRAHFGLGSNQTIDSLRISWPDGKTQLMTNLHADQSITLNYTDAAGTNSNMATGTITPLFAPVAEKYGIAFRHKERDAIDYNTQPSIPHKLSQYGPGIAVGDVDNNGYDDFYIGGAVGKHGYFFMQDANGNFAIDSTRFLQLDDGHPAEDMGLLFFDADNDGDPDLYVVSGSYELPPNEPASQDVLYINDGKGKFKPSYSSLPRMFTNGACVRAADIDGDGDLDLFVGGRVVSGAYPLAPKSYILINYSGTFVDASNKYCPALQQAGMITDALWSDFDNDGKPDLITTGEWMPVSFYKNTGHSLELVNDSTGIDQHTGWWNSIIAGDFDNDGDIDYVAGNLGLNSNYKATMQEPMLLYAKDFDENGLVDPLVFCYMKAEDGKRKPFPMTTRDDMISQMIGTRKKFPTYKAYGKASLDEFLKPGDKENALLFTATDMNSSYIENKGNGKFAISPLPAEAQFAPVYGMQATDINNDGNLDLVLVGNDYGMEPYSGRHDAFNGLCLAGDGKGKFSSLSIASSGFFVKGDGKALATVHTAKDGDILVATQNQDSVKVFGKNSPQENNNKQWITLQPNDFSAEVFYKNNSKRKLEFYYGSGFLSQSSRKIPISKNATRVLITDYRGNKREALQ